MAKVEYGHFTIGGTGLQLPILSDSSLDIKRLVFFISSSSTEAAAGYYDSSVNFTGSSAYTDESTSKPITHYRNIGGVKTKVFEANVVYLDVGEFQINVTTCTQTTVLRFVAFGN